MPDTEQDDPAGRAASLVERGPRTDAPSRYGVLSRATRHLSLRLNRHERLHEQAVHREILAAIAAAADTAARTDRQVARLGSRLEALARRIEATRDRLIEVELQAARSASSSPVGAPSAVAESWRSRLAASVTGERPADAGDEQHHRAVEVETDVGSLLVSAHDRVVHHVLRDTGVWEKEESDALRGLLAPGMTFVDIGAHVGYMTRVALEAVGPTGLGIALEPAPGNFELLQANLLRRGASQVHAIPAAAWKETGRVPLSLSDVNTGDHRAYPRPGTPTIDVLAFALDDVIPPDLKIDVVKVDAQGTDHLALQGMERTLAHHRPVVLVEYWPPGISELGDDPLGVLRGYRAMGFRVSVLGCDQLEHDAPLERILAFAVVSPGSFCTLVLHPVG